MEFLSVAEPGHQGHLLVTGRRALAVDPPLDVDSVAEFLPAWVRLTGVVETGVPVHRVAGGRLLAAELDVALYGPGSAIRGAAPLHDGGRVAGFPEVRAVAAPGRDPAAVCLLAGRALLVGDLDSPAWASSEGAGRVLQTRRDLADRFSAAIAYGSAGIRPVAELASLPPPASGRAPLNAEAVAKTNRGAADMFWADPRFGPAAPRIAFDGLAPRLRSPWAPIVIDLRPGGEDIEGARRVAPARLASELDSLAGGKEIVVIADEKELAAAAARFIGRLGMTASYAVVAASPAGDS